MALRLADCLAIPELEHDAFMASSRGERSIEVLGVSTEPDFAIPTSLTRPKFLDESPSVLTPPHSFIVRGQTLTDLYEHLEAAREGSGHVVFVAGEAGRGKTSLMAEFARQAQSVDRELLVAFGRSSAIAAFSEPFVPFREILNILCGNIEVGWRAGQLYSGEYRTSV